MGERAPAKHLAKIFAKIIVGEKRAVCILRRLAYAHSKLSSVACHDSFLFADCFEEWVQDFGAFRFFGLPLFLRLVYFIASRSAIPPLG
jgi:hypothetical protein